ncbi:MAG: hypothetical protein CMM50_06065 [Rhodospirillaceae bacterium]|nr:hypothetical protein [Rhodospirillaceae bacterium]
MADHAHPRHATASKPAPAAARKGAVRSPARRPFGPTEAAPSVRSAPESAGSVMLPEEPRGVFGPDGQDLGNAEASLQSEEVGAETASETAGETTTAGTETETESAAAAEAAPAEGAAAPPAAAPAPAAPKPLLLFGPRELWYFDGETPATYTVSDTVKSNKSGGVFAWTVSAHLTLSSASAAEPVITTASSSPRRGATVALRHTAADGTVTRASYALTVRAPDSLNHLRNVDTADATWGYDIEVHYSIEDNLGTTLPRNVPINEDFTAAPTADFAGMDWRRGGEGSATVSPADWFDHIQGETAGHTPTPVGPAHADAGVAVYHWPGNWHVGSLTTGSGTNVASVTWQKNRGFARHT